MSLNSNLKSDAYNNIIERYHADHSRFTNNKSAISIHSDLNLILEKSFIESENSSFVEEFEENGSDIDETKQRFRYSKEFLNKIKYDRASLIKRSRPKIFKDHSDCMNGKYWDAEKYFDKCNSNKTKTANKSNNVGKLFEKSINSNQVFQLDSLATIQGNNNKEERSNADKFLLNLLKKDKIEEHKKSNEANLNIIDILNKNQPSLHQNLAPKFVTVEELEHNQMNNIHNIVSPKPKILTVQELESQMIDNQHMSQNSNNNLVNKNILPTVLTLKELESFQMNQNSPSLTKDQKINEIKRNDSDFLLNLLNIRVNDTNQMSNNLSYIANPSFSPSNLNKADTTRYFSHSLYNNKPSPIDQFLKNNSKINFETFYENSHKSDQSNFSFENLMSRLNHNVRQQVLNVQDHPMIENNQPNILKWFSRNAL